MNPGPLVDEMMDGIQPDQSDDDEIDRNDEVEQPRHEQDEDAGNERDQRRDFSGGDDHWRTSGWEWIGGRSGIGGNARTLNAQTAVGFLASFQRAAKRRARNDHYPSILEKSATARVAARISLRSFRRFSRSA